jgi:hypothetical protein
LGWAYQFEDMSHQQQKWLYALGIHKYSSWPPGYSEEEEDLSGSRVSGVMWEEVLDNPQLWPS